MILDTGRRAGIALFFAALFAMTGVRFAAAETFITIPGIPVDVTAKSANAARDRAIAEAQIKAFDRLVKQIVPNPDDQARIHPTREEIESFVQDFAVGSERTSSVRYIGRYTVRFRSSQVRGYLAAAGISAISEPHQVLILPLFRTAKRPLLWEQGNAWRAAWDVGGFGDGPVTLILPNADAFDTATLTASGAQSGDVAALVPLAQRYNAAGVVVADAAANDPVRGLASGLKVTLTTYDIGGVKSTTTLMLDAVQGEQPDKLLHRAVAEAAQTLETGWEQSIAANGSIGLVTDQADGAAVAAARSRLGASYPIAMPIAEIADWVKLRDALNAVPGVQRLALDALTREQVAFTVDFLGDPVALQGALADSGFVLVQTEVAGPQVAGSLFLKRIPAATSQ